MTDPASRPDAIENRVLDASAYLDLAREHDAAGRMLDAIAAYRGAIRLAERDSDSRVLAEALRLLAIVHHRRQEKDQSRACGERSYQVAAAIGETLLSARVLNTLASFDLEAGEHEVALHRFTNALALGARSPSLRGRIEQNLGILANIHGDLEKAQDHYQRSLEAFLAGDDVHGCAIAYHNLGMISADREEWEEAERHYRESQSIAQRLRDSHLEALCLLNQTEVSIARQQYGQASRSVRRALHMFDQLGDTGGKAGGQCFLGMIYRATGAAAEAEARLRDAIALSTDGRHPLEEAEAVRELALLYQDQGLNREALQHLSTAHRLFGRLSAQRDQVDVARKVTHLEDTYLAVMRDWGQSIESADAYTHGHCERVAGYGVALAKALSLEECDQVTIRVGAYLHDVGKIRVPAEILNKAGPLTPDEFALVEQHPVWGLELLASVDFPWDIKPIIRWHHEKLDGTGYPDGLRGDEIPLTAQIICLVDVYDALTTTRSYKPAFTTEAAIEILQRNRHWWRPAIFRAFTQLVAV